MIVFGFYCEFFYFVFFKQKTAYEMRISDWSSDVCSSDLGKPWTRCRASAWPRSTPGWASCAGDAARFPAKSCPRAWPKPIRSKPFWHCASAHRRRAAATSWSAWSTRWPTARWNNTPTQKPKPDEEEERGDEQESETEGK